MSGPHISANGEVLSSALVPAKGYSNANHQQRSAFALLSGQIQQIYTIDDSENDPDEEGVYTVFDVLVTHPDGTTELLRRCLLAQPMFGGGINNFMECVPNQPGPKAKKALIAPALKRGSIVLVGFISGQKSRPVIIGTLPHPSPVAVENRPTEDDGSILKGEFQGLNWEINNDGEMTITFNGPRDDEGEPVDDTLGPTEIMIDKDGNLEISTNEEQSVEINRVEKTMTVINGPITLILAQEEGKVTLTCDNIEIETTKDLKATIEGEANIAVTGDVSISSESKINLARGSATPAEPFILGKKWASFMKDVLSAIGQITHLGNLGAPTPPPINAAKFSALSAQVDSLLSELIIGDN